MPAQNYDDMKLEELEAEAKRRAVLLNIQLTRTISESLSVGYDSNFIDPREPLYDEPGFGSSMSGALPGNLNNQGRGEHLPIYLNSLGLKEVRDQSRWLCAYNEFAINAINNRIAYIIGTGLKYRLVRRYDDPRTPRDETGGSDDNLTRHGQAVLDQFADDNDWGELEAEVVRRCDRDGECFLRFFTKQRGLTVRVVEPEFVVESNSDSAHSFGVITDPDDVQTVRGYNVMEHPYKGLPAVEVPAYEILHIKTPGSDRTHKRGLPIFFPVRKNLERVEKLLRNMSVLAQVQSTYAVIRKHSNASAAAITNAAALLTDTTYQDRSTGRTNSIQQLKPGSIIDTTANSEYEFPSASVNGGAYVEVMQADLRAVASCLGFPEWMITSKSDGVNFASALVSEAPHTKQMERHQKHFARKFGEGAFRRTHHQPVMWRVLVMAVKHGRLPREVLTQCEIQVECPRLTSRDKSGDTNRMATLKQNGIVSDKTWATLEDLDYEQEQRNMATEKPKEGEQGAEGQAPGGQPGQDQDGSPQGQGQDEQGGDDDMPTDDELNDLLAQLKQENGSGSGGQGGEVSTAQSTVAGQQRPQTGLKRGQRPGTISESLTEAESVPAPVPVAHRKTQEIARDGEGNIVRIETTITPLASQTPTPVPTAETATP